MGDPAGAQVAEWTEAGGGYALALDGAKVLCRNAKGKVLATVPASLRDGEVATQLRALRDWLAGHDRSCLAAVEAWMLRSLPVPAAVLAAVWDDPSWQGALVDTVVAPLARNGGLDWSRAGLLRHAGAGTVGVVDLDGETVRLNASQVAVPHPVLFEELEGWRELASDLEVTQGVPQLHREVFRRGPEVKSAATALEDFADAEFAELRQATARCRTIGVLVSGGYAVCRVWEGGEPCEARYWIGSDYPEAPTWTGDLVWVTPEGRRLALGAVGPVSWSEGVRMATLVHAARNGVEDPGG